MEWNPARAVAVNITYPCRKFPGSLPGSEWSGPLFHISVKSLQNHSQKSPGKRNHCSSMRLQSQHLSPQVGRRLSKPSLCLAAESFIMLCLWCHFNKSLHFQEGHLLIQCCFLVSILTTNIRKRNFFLFFVLIQSCILLTDGIPLSLTSSSSFFLQSGWSC